MHSIVTPTQSLSFCITAFSASPTNCGLFQSQSHDCSCYVIRRIWHLHRSHCRSILTSVPATARTVLTCDIGLDLLTLPPPEAGDFLELICTGTCCSLMKPSKIETFQNRLQGSIQTTIIFCMSVRLSVCMGTNQLQQERIFCKITHTHTHICVYLIFIGPYIIVIVEKKRPT